MPDDNRYDGSLKDPKELKGVYRALVVNNVDPMGIGRVQVRIPLLHGADASGGISDASLPWASMCSTSAGYNFGSFMVPEIGEYAFVTFEDSDPEKPVYLGSTFGTGSRTYKKYGSKDTVGMWVGKKGGNEVPAEAQTSVPTVRMLYKTRLGSKIYLDTANDTEKIVIEDELGQKFFIDTKNKEVLVQGIGNSVQLKDKKLYLNGSDGVEVTGKYFEVNTDKVKMSFSSGGVGLSSDGNVNIKSGSSVMIRGSSGITLRGSHHTLHL